MPNLIINRQKPRALLSEVRHVIQEVAISLVLARLIFLSALTFVALRAVFRGAERYIWHYAAPAPIFTRCEYSFSTVLTLGFGVCPYLILTIVDTGTPVASDIWRISASLALIKRDKTGSSIFMFCNVPYLVLLCQPQTVRNTAYGNVLCKKLI
jgi:hypothetical protein